MNECRSFTEDYFIGRKLFEEDVCESFDGDQILQENLLKLSSHTMSPWLPDRAFAAAQSDNRKSCGQLKTSPNKHNKNLQADTQTHARRMQGIYYRYDTRQEKEFTFKHYQDPEKYMEEYRKCHAFGGPLETVPVAMTAHAPTSLSTNRRRSQPNNELYSSTQRSPRLQIHEPLKRSLSDLQLVSRRPPVLPRRLGESSKSVSRNSSSSHQALTENAKSRRRVRSAKTDALLRDYKNRILATTQRNSSDAFLQAYDVLYKLPHTSTASPKYLNVCLPHDGIGMFPLKSKESLNKHLPLSNAFRGTFECAKNIPYRSLAFPGEPIRQLHAHTYPLGKDTNGQSYSFVSVSSQITAGNNTRPRKKLFDWSHN